MFETGEPRVTKQKSPHTQTEQNQEPFQSDFDPGSDTQAADTEDDEKLYEEMEGAETGGTRSPRKIPPRSVRHNTLPETEAFEGRVSSRTPHTAGQGISSHSAEEESERQEKVVKDRPDAQAGLNHSK